MADASVKTGRDIWSGRSGGFEDLSRDTERVARFKEVWERFWLDESMMSGLPKGFPVSDLEDLIDSEEDTRLQWRLESDMRQLAVYHPNEFVRDNAVRYFELKLKHERERVRTIERRIEGIATDSELGRQLTKLLAQHASEILTKP